MSTQLAANSTLNSGARGYVEAGYTNPSIDAATILYALNGTEGGPSAGVTFNDISTPISDPISGTRQLSFTVNPYTVAQAQNVSNAAYNALNSIPGIFDIQMGGVFAGSSTTATLTSTVTYAIFGIVAILILILLVEKNI